LIRNQPSLPCQFLNPSLNISPHEANFAVDPQHR
jgi:hypothetical protein